MNDVTEPRENGFSTFVNPIVIISLLILFAVFVLIGAAIVGYDKGVLVGMARVEFARGLITYLFAVVTIGTAVVLVVSALTGTESDAHKERFQRGKEILSLLLGVFGTIVGFYFGSEVARGQNQVSVIQVAPLHLSAQSGTAGSSINIDTFLSGGVPPYRVGIGFDAEEVQLSEKVDSSGWFSKAVSLPKVSADQAVTIHVVVEDAEGHRGEKFAPVIVKTSPAVK